MMKRGHFGHESKLTCIKIKVKLNVNGPYTDGQQSGQERKRPNVAASLAALIFPSEGNDVQPVNGICHTSYHCREVENDVDKRVYARTHGKRRAAWRTP